MRDWQVYILRFPLQLLALVGIVIVIIFADQFFFDGQSNVDVIIGYFIGISTFKIMDDKKTLFWVRGIKK